MATLHVTELDGKEHALEAKVGWSVMEIIRNSDVNINAICGGSCSCSTCHVHVDPEWFARIGGPNDDEKDTLELADDLADTSRLGCQIQFDDSMDGLKVKMTRDSAE